MPDTQNLPIVIEELPASPFSPVFYTPPTSPPKHTSLEVDVYFTPPTSPTHKPTLNGIPYHILVNNMLALLPWYDVLAARLVRPIFA